MNETLRKSEVVDAELIAAEDDELLIGRDDKLKRSDPAPTEQNLSYLRYLFLPFCAIIVIATSA